VSELVLPVELAGTDAPCRLEVVVASIGLPRLPGRRGPRPPRQVERLDRTEVRYDGVWVGAWAEHLPAPFSVLVYRSQLPPTLEVGSEVVLVGLHALLEPGRLGALGPLRLGLRCERIELLR